MDEANSYKSLSQFLNELEEQNKTLSDWAREKDFPLALVFAVARGRITGKRGQSREILIAMGVRPPPMFERYPTAAAARNTKAA